MSTSALVMMCTTWSVVGFFAIRFLCMVATRPLHKDDDEPPQS